MYILIDYIKNPMGRKCTMAFDNFADLKDSCIRDLEVCSYDRKSSVDLRSIDSCVRYLLSDHRGISYHKSTSYKKYCEYRYGKKACMP
jgi:hypothetical protein